MYEAAASCKDIAWAPVTNWEPHCVTLAEYCYTVRHGMKVQLVTLCRVSHLQCYSVWCAVMLQVCAHLNTHPTKNCIKYRETSLSTTCLTHP